MGRRSDLIGRRFGKLVVMEFDSIDAHKNSMWLCKCDCGNMKVIRGSKLKCGEIKSCGCSQWEFNPEKNAAISNAKMKHGLSGTRLYYIYDNMIKRCYDDSSEKYHNYGARGITVCDEWREDKENFFRWAKSSGYSDRLTIDRIDVNGNYEPSNCKWSTSKQQANNKTNNVLISFNNETHTIAEWSDITGIQAKTIYARVKRGWTGEESVSVPVNSINHNTK